MEKTTNYEKQTGAMLKEVERILREGGDGKALTIVIEMGIDRVPSVTYQIKDKVVKH